MVLICVNIEVLPGVGKGQSEHLGMAARLLQHRYLIEFTHTASQCTRHPTQLRVSTNKGPVVSKNSRPADSTFAPRRSLRGRCLRQKFRQHHSVTRAYPHPPKGVPPKR